MISYLLLHCTLQLEARILTSSKKETSILCDIIYICSDSPTIDINTDCIELYTLLEIH